MQLPSMNKKLAWGTSAVALLVPAAAQAGGARPDDRAGLRGAEPTLLASVRPDDRAGIRGVGTNRATNLAVRNERTLERGAGAPASDVVDRYLRSHAGTTASSAQASGARPDDRAGLRGAEPTLLANPATNLAIRPDERALELGAGPAAPAVVDLYLRSHPSPIASSASSAWYSQRSAWFDGGMAAAFVLAAMSIAAAGFLLIRHQRAPAST